MLALCLRGLLVALSHADPNGVYESLALAERAFAAAPVEDNAVEDRSMHGLLPSQIETGRGSGDNAYPPWTRERAFLAALRAWAAGRWRMVKLFSIDV